MDPKGLLIRMRFTHRMHALNVSCLPFKDAVMDDYYCKDRRAKWNSQREEAWRQQGSLPLGSFATTLGHVSWSPSEREVILQPLIIHNIRGTGEVFKGIHIVEGVSVSLFSKKLLTEGSRHYIQYELQVEKSVEPRKRASFTGRLKRKYSKFNVVDEQGSDGESMIPQKGASAAKIPETGKTPLMEVSANWPEDPLAPPGNMLSANTYIAPYRSRSRSPRRVDISSSRP
jgi:hypothetical protein